LGFLEGGEEERTIVVFVEAWMVEKERMFTQIKKDLKLLFMILD